MEKHIHDTPQGNEAGLLTQAGKRIFTTCFIFVRR